MAKIGNAQKTIKPPLFFISSGAYLGACSKSTLLNFIVYHAVVKNSLIPDAYPKRKKHKSKDDWIVVDKNTPVY
ncbi:MULTISPECIES: hypothetical protein [Serratia]|uniref:hypothetical protein n=1 Tax=Serratia TaxID=613 RepID=UPI000AAB2C89|nr:hypothetical protein [Serratia sp. 506_PEND]